MKFQVLRENLQTGLKTILPAIARAYHPPVLSNVFVEARADRVHLAGTDLEIRLDCNIGAKVDQPGQTTVPARLLLDLVNSLPPERVDFVLEETHKGGKLHVRCDKNKAILQCIPASEFPLVPELAHGSHLATLPGDVLKTMVNRCLIATPDRDSGRPVLAGVLMRFEGPDLTMAATDGFRLSIVKEHFEGKSLEPQAVIVPAWGFSSSKGFGDGDVQVLVDDARAAFRTEHASLTTQLIAGKFPDYNQIIPSGYDTKTVVSTDALLRACKTARIFARLQAEIMRLEIRDDTLRIVSETDEMGGVNATIPAQVEPSSGSDHWLDIAFNAKFFLEALDIMGSEQVQLLTTDSTSPAIVRPVGEEADKFTHVLMPMMLKSMPK